MKRKPGACKVIGKAARHQERANVVLRDGHAETIKLKPLFKDYSPTTLDRWNLDYDPHR